MLTDDDHILLLLACREGAMVQGFDAGAGLCGAGLMVQGFCGAGRRMLMVE